MTCMNCASESEATSDEGCEPLLGSDIAAFVVETGNGGDEGGG